jgi:transposase
MNAYSEDLRMKIVKALGRGMGKSEAARTFTVSLSSVKRYAKLAEEGRPLAPKKRSGSKPKLDERASKLLEEDVKERPFVTLQKRREYLRSIASVEVSRSTVCLDNLPAHKPDRVRELIEGRGCELLYLPGYSPDYNPIEEAFSKIKEILRRAAARTREALVEALGLALLSAVSREDARGFFEHAGYRLTGQLL